MEDLALVGEGRVRAVVGDERKELVDEPDAERVGENLDCFEGESEGIRPEPVIR